VRFSDGSDDGEYWAGYYGAMFRLAYVTSGATASPTATCVSPRAGGARARSAQTARYHPPHASQTAILSTRPDAAKNCAARRVGPSAAWR
jgi:hypothetical protein